MPPPDSIDTLKPADLITPGGERWVDRRRGLKPKWPLIWGELALCHLFVWLGPATVVWLEIERAPLWVALSGGLAAAVLVGFWLHALGCFGHEAAHFNLAPSRATNEWIANLTIFPFFGPTVASYRRFHWEHHKHLGELTDTEISYVDCMSPARMFELFTGLRLARGLLSYLPGVGSSSGGEASVASAQGASSDDEEKISGLTYFGLARTALLHVALFGALVLTGFYAAALAWLLGVVVVYPALNTIRQTLEHRHLDAACAADYRVTPHGPNTHMFGTGPFARFFGAAGFNSHLLHHLDPTVSYTNFREFEDFLAEAGMTPVLDSRRVSYLGAFRRTVRAALDG